MLQTVLRSRWRWFLGAAVVVCASASPTYGALVLLLFYPGLRVSSRESYRFWTRVALAVAISAASLIAMKVFQSPAWTPAAAPRSVPGQFDFLWHHPAAVFSIAIETRNATVPGARSISSASLACWAGLMRRSRKAFILRPAWRSLRLLLSSRHSIGNRSTRQATCGRLMLIVPMLACFALTFAALFLTWTPVTCRATHRVGGARAIFHGARPVTRACHAEAQVDFGQRILQQGA
ncbi:hypothetical protein BRCH_00133 [Candidatus Burkholderia brachyanthoides]|nr:hypothetical protein BRCH_00133 [Candidatus Burkholderia brachyanthoides]